MTAAATDITASVYWLFREGKLDEALELAQAALVREPDHGRLWELRGLIHAAREEWHQAQHALETASVLVPLQPTGQLSLAECYRHLGLIGPARELLHSLKDQRDLPLALLLPLAALLDRVDHPREAVGICRRVIRQEPDRADAWFDLARYLSRSGRPADDIEAAARRAVELRPEHAGYRVTLACFLLSQGRASEAHQPVEHLEIERIAHLCCDCCLAKLAAIFDEAADYRRVYQCRQLLRKSDRPKPHC